MKNSKINIVEITEAGKLNIPKSIMEQLSFPPKGTFLVLTGKDFITLKRIEKATPAEKFEAIAKETQKKSRALNINKKVAAEAVAWARKKS